MRFFKKKQEENLLKDIESFVAYKQNESSFELFIIKEKNSLYFEKNNDNLTVVKIKTTITLINNIKSNSYLIFGVNEDSINEEIYEFVSKIRIKLKLSLKDQIFIYKSIVEEYCNMENFPCNIGVWCD